MEEHSIVKRLEELESERKQLLGMLRGINEHKWESELEANEGLQERIRRLELSGTDHEKRINQLEQSQIPQSSHDATVDRLVNVMIEKKKFKSKRQWYRLAKVAPKTFYNNVMVVEKKLKQKGWRLLQKKVNNIITVWIE